jgi:hypothetical protein
MTSPQEPIRLAIIQSIPWNCDCTWEFDTKSDTKSLKFLYANCGVLEHRQAFAKAQAAEEVLVGIIQPTRKRGRPRNPGGQWHKKPVR